MNNKVYYGEYTLRHWINLILKKNIILPDYQRYFVWDQNKTKELIKAFKEKQFIPPVTIGSFKNEKESINLILDGQQRLTSILLAYIGIFPNKISSQKQLKLMDENDNLIEDEGINNILEWNFNELFKNGSTKEEIKENLSYENYIKFDFNVDKDFFDNNFLGFSYLVPLVANDKEQQKFYSKVFRSINIQGESLLALESRAALYYLDKDLEDYFIPKFIEKIYVNDSKVDFVRYLALLSQYKKDKTADELGKRFAGKMEKYYEEYIYFTVGEEDSNIFIKYSELFKDKKEYKKMYINLKESLKELELFKKYSSIIDVDITLFGLIYFIVFEKKEIDYTKKESIFKEINKEIEKIRREDTKHVKNPAAFKYLRYRVKRSIEIYARYVKNE
ncbi:DUF262 domain-containing protein [Fusobacterium polymorphum]|uniref:GmrSD restriction endonucleases N-terminal domain-containing protein n=1 Tax=Fusobacterium nucleatum subsp. polymorphum TaxID=76857 RepID=A0AAC9A0V5_FUSNP|nr:DUF262 domain-containing protein [Fusobacterium polymorphum]ALM94707.1 hypothetical protein RO02_08755 [Fusobacterium polymorphum]ALQ43130.1 hypothetical protein RN93_10130 [Fusobacterium polymorphum]QYR59372.1 DUF262 domain-containing protein [Fusobacterium polymorphum]